MPPVRNTVTGQRRTTANTRLSSASASVPQNEAATTEIPPCTASQYTTQPTMPVRPQGAHSRRGAWNRMANASTAMNDTPH